MNEIEVKIHRLLSKVDISDNSYLEEISMDFISNLIFWYDKDLSIKQEKFLYFLFHKHSKKIKSYKKICCEYNIETPFQKHQRELNLNPELGVKYIDFFKDFEKILLEKLNENGFISTDDYRYINLENISLREDYFKRICKKHDLKRISLALKNNQRHAIYFNNLNKDTALKKAYLKFNDLIISKKILAY